ncbi:hypothetical protein DNTS_014582 [Danionella cerebrum]|uniref:Uncharacterized protein n=1 Tax=Danionella cerebrum TaxID=2873325 RepID=A0A553Q763_9TELE|nr:hypothetical protein DNTS_014582 [Danionella translucida]
MKNNDNRTLHKKKQHKLKSQQNKNSSRMNPHYLFVTHYTLPAEEGNYVTKGFCGEGVGGKSHFPRPNEQQPATLISPIRVRQNYARNTSSSSTTSSKDGGFTTIVADCVTMSRPHPLLIRDRPITGVEAY